jgi:hypothetical protein
MEFFGMLFHLTLLNKVLQQSFAQKLNATKRKKEREHKTRFWDEKVKEEHKNGKTKWHEWEGIQNHSFYRTNISFWCKILQQLSLSLLFCD